MAKKLGLFLWALLLFLSASSWGLPQECGKGNYQQEKNSSTPSKGELKSAQKASVVEAALLNSRECTVPVTGKPPAGIRRFYQGDHPFCADLIGKQFLLSQFGLGYPEQYFDLAVQTFLPTYLLIKVLLI